MSTQRTFEHLGLEGPKCEKEKLSETYSYENLVGELVRGTHPPHVLKNHLENSRSPATIDKVHTKHNIRAEIKQKRQSLGRFKKISFNKELRKQLETFEPFLKAKNILFYASMPQEIDTLKLIKKYNKDKNIILPTVCTDTNTLKLYHLKNLRELRSGYQGILEIPHCLKDTHKPEEIDFCIVPGLAFDPQGNRIGYGKGFYDELLKKVKAKKVALAYHFQIYESIPASKYDVPVDFIITPDKIINASFGKQSDSGTLKPEGLKKR